MKKTIIFGTLLLSGCAGMEQLDSGLNAFKGRTSGEIFQVLGYPDRQQTFDNITVYTWHRTVSGVSMYSVPQTVYGRTDKKRFSATVTETQYVPVNYSCRIQIGAGHTGIIKNYSWDGDMNGCDIYIRRLNAWRSSR